MKVQTKDPANEMQKSLIEIALDASKPLNMRSDMLLHAILTGAGEPALANAVLREVLARAGEAGESKAKVDEAAKLKKLYEQALTELQKGPPRPATYIGPGKARLPWDMPRARVITPDGQERLPMLHEEIKKEKLEPGMTVYLDATGALLIGVCDEQFDTGEEAVFLRRLPESDRIEVAFQEVQIVIRANESVLRAHAAGELTRGDKVLFCSRRHFAFEAIKAEQDRRHRFVADDKVPDIVVGRDIGRPHWVLSWLVNRLHILLHRKDLLEEFGLRQRFNVLMCGRTGTGKTLTIQAFIRAFHDELRSYSGRADLGSRVMRIKSSEMLSEWFGRSEKQIDALFDDIVAIASEEIELADGRRTKLPLIVIFEEAEGMARRRGDFDSGPYDRIIGTLLQRLDDPTESLNQLPVIWITTSNRPDLFDSAMNRRLAGVRALFTRLDREGTAAVLGKKLKAELPYRSHNGTPKAELRRNLIDQVVGWLFSPNGADPGQTEITFRDGKKQVHHRRDFLTGAVIEQAVANAIDRVVFSAAESGENIVGLDATRIIDSLAGVIDGLADNLTAQNVADYLDLPQNVSIASVRRMPNGPGGMHRLTA
jgi:ATP-dependent 26S proteasome regulatory subunit